MEIYPDRHLECSECHKPIRTIYTEIVGKMIYRLAMCADCPILRQKLHGLPATAPTPQELLESGLSCGGCGTTVDDIKRGAMLGCAICYDVFDEVIIQELTAAGRISPKLATLSKAATLHIGRLPGQPAEVNPALKLFALNQALQDTLRHEDYEQAAWLRDQIQALTEQYGHLPPPQPPPANGYQPS